MVDYSEKLQNSKIKMRPYVRSVRFFCAVAILVAASIEISGNLNEMATMSISGIAGLIATIIAKKTALLA